VIHVLHLGLVPYDTALHLQRTLLQLRKAGRIDNTLLLLEHPPVITLGRNAKLDHVLASPEFLAKRGVELFEIDRGGDVTFHGPGQLVAYPIFDLRSFQPKVGAVEFVRRLEEVLIRTCGDFAIGTQRISGMTGVWTYALRNKPEAKIAALGVHISRGVTTHGFALNVSTDLDYFDLIVPCGLNGEARHVDGAGVAEIADDGRSCNRRLAQLRARLSVADAVAGVAGRLAGAGFCGARTATHRISA
jgi:lipoyl(octanoyl) transferase